MNAHLEPSPVERPRGVTIIGGIWLAAAAFRFVQDVAAYAVWRLGGLERGLPAWVLGWVPPSESPVAVDTLIRGIGPIAIGQGVIAAALGIVAWNLLRMRSWARTTIVAASWILAVTIACVILFAVATTAGRAGSHSPADRQRFVESAVVVVALGIAVVGLLGAAIRYLRRPDVRAAFSSPR